MKNQRNEQVGDAKTPALRPTESGLRSGVDQAVNISADRSAHLVKSVAKDDIAPILKAAIAQQGTPTTCTQKPWLSFFFDGTGNNLAADLTLSKHSNIVRLYRAHKPESQKDGIFSLYILGIGTYFPEIGDDGGSMLGLGCGSMGKERLEFALERFDLFLAPILARANSPSNAISEINVAAFGFSRGAALARAFLNMVMQERCELRQGRWWLQKGGWLVRFRFLGLFDTVASVGVAMGANTVGYREAYDGNTLGMIKKRLKEYEETRPEKLAFNTGGGPGADPAPGREHGHRGWGSRLSVHEAVEEVRHFIAGHEIRNSFPVDSISVLRNDGISRVHNFHEAIYPGAHSDVGGGYSVGEGARGFISSKNLCLVPLDHMYGFAQQCGVPMLPKWGSDNESDFKMDDELRDAYNYYLKCVGTFATLGRGFNKHMALYYAWRFRTIRQKADGNESEASLIKNYTENFRRSEALIAKKVENLSIKENAAHISLNATLAAKEMQEAKGESAAQNVKPISEADIEKKRKSYEDVRGERLREKARLDAVPNMGRFQAMLDLYDRQLLTDVRSILSIVHRDGKKRNDLRPHYKVLLEAYENEFEKNSGLKDEKVISFFENYVHDSLAGFGKDATLPSDPRVVYLGGNEKYKYASMEDQEIMMSDQKLIA